MLEKNLLEYPDVFADVANAVLFSGKQVIQPSELIEVDAYESSCNCHNSRPIRDVAMKWIRNGVTVAVIGLLNEMGNEKDVEAHVNQFVRSQQQMIDMKNSDCNVKASYPVLPIVLNFGMNRLNKPVKLKN